MAKLYLYQEVSPVSGNYHDSGGVVIVTDRDPQAVWALQGVAEGWSSWTPGDLGEADQVYEVGDEAERVVIFPDAGCC